MQKSYAILFLLYLQKCKYKEIQYYRIEFVGCAGNRFKMLPSLTHASLPACIHTGTQLAMKWWPPATPAKGKEMWNSLPQNEEGKKTEKIHAQFISVTLGNCVDIFHFLATARSDFHFIFWEYSSALC